ncbi:unnamed protein product [Rhodiola kirilowii]
MIKRRRTNGSNEFVVPLIPKAPRSARRISSKKKPEKRVCAFNLLAAVAGMLLQENEHSSASSTETETKDQFVVIDKAALKSEPQNLDTDCFQKKERQISNDHLFALSTLDVFENVEAEEPIKDESQMTLANCCPKPYHERDEGFLSSPIRKKKFCHQSSAVTSDTGISGESFSKPQECANMNKNPNPHFNGANEECSSMETHPASCHARDSQVRLSIMSFEVPELHVEVPVTTTVGSLKATVLEAVLSILHEGFDVEVIVEGKKIRDDTNTLIQSGIFNGCNLESLGFMLKPRCPQTSSARCDKDSLVLTTLDDHKHSERYPVSALPDSEISDGPLPFPSLSEQVQTDHNLAPTATDALPEKFQESKALALFPVTRADPLSIVQMVQKTKRSELAQRRTRRPFSTAEVEALVQAVEELGTGRWRDVKMRSFENAEHRTYVDLKDKWKTLVHTAQISPQKRRGQPVPQEVLNRVLVAHSYWSQHHQVKSHTKLNFR